MDLLHFIGLNLKCQRFTCLGSLIRLDIFLTYVNWLCEMSQAVVDVVIVTLEIYRIPTATPTHFRHDIQ